MSEKLLVPAEHLEDFSGRVFAHHGLPPQDAVTVARALVFSNLRGVDTHGVARIPSYVRRLEQGLVNPRPVIRSHSQFPAAVVVDGDNGMGAVVGQAAITEAIERAERYGIGIATASHSNHFGAASFFALQAVDRGCIGLALSPASKSLAPFGSRQPLLGTNPIAVAVPAGRHAPWSMDMATSVAARGHIRLAASHGKAIPGDWALDAEGRPTTDAAAALKGVMLPFAGPKGSAIAMMVDILGGVLAGSAFGGEIRDMNVDFTAPQNVGHCFVAVKVEAFMAPDEFGARMEEEIARLKALEPAAGFAEVLYPGEPEARNEAARRQQGVPVTPEILQQLDEVGRIAKASLRRAG